MNDRLKARIEHNHALASAYANADCILGRPEYLGGPLGLHAG